MDHCENLEEFLKIQIEVIQRNVNDHKYYRHLAKLEDGIEDFIKEFGGIYREMFCVYVCKNKETCNIAKSLAKHYDEVEAKLEKEKG